MPEEEQTKPMTQADKYLRIYNAEIKWQPHIDRAKEVLLKRLSEVDMNAEMSKRIACTILLPAYDPNTIQDPPQNLLFYCPKWAQYDAPWVDRYEKVKAQDLKNKKIREECLDLGVIFPYEYNPITRQAFNWLYDKAEKSGVISAESKEEITKKLKNLVFAYGGVVICSIFQKPELEYRLKKLHNWRSGYFFERLIHQTYKGEELIKIKTHELAKIKNVDPKLVKNIKKKEEE